MLGEFHSEPEKLKRLYLRKENAQQLRIIPKIAEVFKLHTIEHLKSEQWKNRKEDGRGAGFLGLRF
jgi:hypothetical protein